MNKREVSEIKKIFNPGNGFFTFNRLLVNIVDGEGEIKHSINKSSALFSEREETMYYTILRSILSTKVGKNLIQYDFPEEACLSHHIHGILCGVKDTGFNDDSINELFINSIINGYQSDTPYAIVAAHCTYTVRHRDRLGIVKDVEDEEYKFVITAICPVIGVDSGFSYNNITGEFSTEYDPKLYIQSKPTDGFIFPAFDNRSANINSVMYYCKKSADADVAIINDVLECNFTYSADQEKETFQFVLQNSFRENTNYALIYNMNNALCDLAEQHKDDTRLYTMSQDDFDSILEEINASAEEIKAFDALYSQYIGENKLTLDNLVENTIKIKTSEYTISLSKSVGNLVSTVVVDGSRTIKLKTEDQQMEVNGAEVSIQ